MIKLILSSKFIDKNLFPVFMGLIFLFVKTNIILQDAPASLPMLFLLGWLVGVLGDGIWAVIRAR